MLQLNNTYLIDDVDEFLSFFSSTFSGGSDIGLGVYEGSEDPGDGLIRRGICLVGAIV